jgi:hypothetical protein
MGGTRDRARAGSPPSNKENNGDAMRHFMTPIRARITGSDCEADGVTVRAAAPVLALCRKLLAAGYDPDRPLHAYRGDVLALKARSIREGAKLTVDESRTPRFVRWKPFALVEGSLRIAPNRLAA